MPQIRTITIFSLCAFQIHTSFRAIVQGKTIPSFCFFLWPSISFFVYACDKIGSTAQSMRQPKQQRAIPTPEACFSLQVGSWLPPATSTCQRATPSGLPIVLGAPLLARERQEDMKEKATRYPCRRTGRITRAEDEKLQRQAAIACIPVAEYMRRLFFGGRPIIARTDNQTIRELRRLGGLLKHNFALASEAHQSEVWSEMSRTLKMIQEAIDRLGHGHATQEV